MAIVLYSTNCPQCKVLEKKLEDAEIEFTMTTDVAKLIIAGIQSAPVLNIHGVYHNFPKAIEWIKQQKG